MSGAIACGTGPSAGAGSGGNFAVRGGGPINFCARLRRERRDDTESSDSSASVCGVCGGGVVYVFWGCSGGGLGGRGVDRGGDCIGWRGRLFGADARDGDAAGSTAGYSGRSRGGEFVLHILCGGRAGFVVAADFIFCARRSDGFSARGGRARGAQRIRDCVNAGNLVGAGAGGVAWEPRGVCDFEVRVFLLFGIAVAGGASAGGLVGRGCASCTFVGRANPGRGCGGFLRGASGAGGLGGAAIFGSDRRRAKTSCAACGGDLGDTMTLLGMRAENVGAFFDVDGTLLPAPSLEWRFIGYLLERDEISSGRVGRWLAGFAGSFWRDLHGATEGNKRYLWGISEEFVSDWERSLGAEFFCGRSLAFFDEALRRIAWHVAQGHRVFLVSGTLAPLARVAARSLAGWVSAEVEVCATELEVAAGSARVWSGRIAGSHMSGDAKLRAVTELAAHYGIDLAWSYAYGDSAADVPMLSAVGFGVAVNPTRRLARVAQRRGWQSCVWEKIFGENRYAAARQLASKAAR